VSAKEKARDHLALVLHFEAIFEGILEECEDCRTCAVEALARKTIEWIEGFDDFVAPMGTGEVRTSYIKKPKALL